MKLLRAARVLLVSFLKPAPEITIKGSGKKFPRGSRLGYTTFRRWNRCAGKVAGIRNKYRCQNRKFRSERRKYIGAFDKRFLEARREIR